jgi:hypothetical protein
MKHYYEHKWFHRKWDFVAGAACLIYIVGIHYLQWTNNTTLALFSLLLAIVYVPFEVRHYAKDELYDATGPKP